MTRPTVHRYGAHQAQFGELWLPDPATHDGARRAGSPRDGAPHGQAPLGTVVIIHGGFWRARYDLSRGRPLAADLAARGYAAWNLEYRRALAGGGWPGTFQDVADGIDLLATLSASTGLPLGTGPVIAVGHSAGGHLAAWAAGRATRRPGRRGARNRARAVPALTR